MIKIAIFASHNGSGFDAIFEAIENKTLHFQISFVLSNNTHSQALKNASKRNINHFLVNTGTHINPDDEIHTLLQEHKCTHIFLSGYMKKLSSLLTKNYTIVNAHPSLLPKFGGAGMYGRFVHEAVLDAKETVSGVSIHYVNEVYDEGKIILQKEIQLEKEETVQSLENKIKALEKIAIVEALEKIAIVEALQNV